MRRREGDSEGENGHTHRAPDWRGALIKISIWVTGLASAMGGQYAFHEYDRGREPVASHDYGTEITKLSDEVTDLKIEVERLVARIDERLPEMRDAIKLNQDRIMALEIIAAKQEARRSAHIGGAP